MATFGEKLKQARKQKGWSQEELGKQIGVHGRHVGKYENGHTMPSAETLVRIATIFNVSTDYLLREDFEETPSARALLKDRELIKKFEAVENMGDEDKHVIMSLIDAYIKKQKIEDVLTG